MRRQRAWATFLGLGAVAAVAVPLSGPGFAADPAKPSAQGRPVDAAFQQAGATILQALRNNPVTAPYRFAVTLSGKQYALAGRVGTKQIHDAAIRTVIALGYPVRDDLTIYTGEVDRVALQVAAGMGAGAGPGTGMGAVPSSTGLPAYATNGLAYVYPPPLWGRLDDPFFGLEPPLITYPPWFGAATAHREPGNVAALNNPSAGVPAQATPLASLAPLDPAVTNPARPIAMGGPPSTAATAPGQLANPIEMTLDSRGVAILRGSVPTLADRVAVGQELARTPGIAQVINLLQVTGTVQVTVAQAPPQVVTSDAPPPAPTPSPPPGPAAQVPSPAVDAAPPAGGAAIAADNDPLARRVADGLARRPSLAGFSIKVTSREGVATLSGRVPSAYEAMLAYRAAQQTPGVREVVDRLEFPIPDVDRPNPLRDKGRPEDIEPYLLAQTRRQVGDLAHVDQVRVRGDALEVRGTVSRADDIPRVEAALRSTPVLRGFHLEPSFQVD